MRVVLVAAAIICAFGAQAANAQVDPLNWCPDLPMVTSPPIGANLARAHRVTHTILANEASFGPTEFVATLQLTPVPRRPVVEAMSDLRVNVGDLLTPMVVLHADTDVLKYYGMAYCAITGPTPGPDPRLARGRNGVCVVPDRDSDNATTAFPAMLSERDGFSGRMAHGGGFGRGHAWATLGDEADAEPAITRRLRLGQIAFSRMPEMSGRPAFNAVSLQFAVEGFPAFTRRLGAPIRIEDGWLVVTDVTSGGEVVMARMDDGQWRAFHEQKCPQPRRP